MLCVPNLYALYVHTVYALYVPTLYASYVPSLYALYAPTCGAVVYRASGLPVAAFRRNEKQGGNTHLSNSSAMLSAAFGYSMKRSSSACACDARFRMPLLPNLFLEPWSGPPSKRGGETVRVLFSTFLPLQKKRPYYSTSVQFGPQNVSNSQGGD